MVILLIRFIYLFSKICMRKTTRFGGLTKCLVLVEFHLQ